MGARDSGRLGTPPELAIAEDLGNRGDLTTSALVPMSDAVGRAMIVAWGGRGGGTACRDDGPGRHCTHGQMVIQGCRRPVDGGRTNAGFDRRTGCRIACRRTTRVERQGSSGVASPPVVIWIPSPTQGGIYDTRKTTLAGGGWRSMLYAAGGGWNHRCGLFEAVLDQGQPFGFWGGRRQAAPLRSRGSDRTRPAVSSSRAATCDGRR